MNALQERKTELDAQLAATEAPVPLLHPNMAEVYRAKVQQLTLLVNDERELHI